MLDRNHIFQLASFNPIPSLLGRLLKKMLLIVLMEHNAQFTRPAEYWLASMAAVEEVKITLMCRKSSETWDRFASELRLVVADLYSNMPKNVTITWADRWKKSPDNKFRCLPLEEVMAVSRQMQNLQGCLVGDSRRQRVEALNSVVKDEVNDTNVDNEGDNHKVRGIQSRHYCLVASIMIEVADHVDTKRRDD